MSKELLQTLRDHLISTQEPDDMYHRCYNRIEELERQRERDVATLECWNKAITELQADNARLRDALVWVRKVTVDIEIHDAIDFALATPEQSLARIRNQVKEEAAKVADAWDYDKRIAAAIRASKEPE